jgi:mannosyltransferase
VSTPTAITARGPCPLSSSTSSLPASPAATDTPHRRRWQAVRQRAVPFATRVYWAWPALAMLVIGGFRITRPALWADELATWGAVRTGWGNLFKLAGDVDAVVTPYYVLLKAWTTVVGTSTLALRLPSLACVVATAALVTAIGERLGSRRAGVAAGLLFAVVPSMSRYGQEARPYAAAILAVTLATFLLLRALPEPTFGRWAAYSVAVAAIGLMHLVALLVLGAHLVAVVNGFRRSSLPRWLLAAGLGVLPALPLVWLGHREIAAIDYIARSDWHSLLGSPGVIFGSWLAGGALMGLAAPAITTRYPALLLAGWALVPVALLWTVGFVVIVWWPRYLLFVVPGWALLAGLALWRSTVARIVISVGLVAGLGIPDQLVIRTEDGHNHGTKEVAGIIAANYRPGDGLAVALHEPIVPWEARDIVARYVPAGRRPRDVFALTPQRTNGTLLATECPDDQLAGCLGDTPRLWIIRFHAHPDPVAGLGPAKEALLYQDFTVQHVWPESSLTVALLVRRPGR